MSTALPPVSIGSLIDDMHDLREQKRDLESQIKDLNAKITDIERNLIAQMESAGVSRTSSAKATASVVESTRYTIEDPDAFFAFVKRNNYFHLLERRPSTAGCRELFEQRGGVPGVIPYTVSRVNLRNL